MRLARALAFVGLGYASLAHTPAAFGDDTIKHPGDHPIYRFEFEPHFLWGWTSYYGGGGYGVGGRLSAPLSDSGFIPAINNSVGITVGVDWLHYDGCYYNGLFGCGASYLFFPVALQWNFFVAQGWSVFGEPGLFIYHGFFDTSLCDKVAGNGCSAPSATGLGPAFYLGGRYHFNEHIALTMRVGYPTFSVGVSFM
jgi:hypothetical protein